MTRLAACLAAVATLLSIGALAAPAPAQAAADARAENAIWWARMQVGSNAWNGWCAKFVANAHGSPSYGYATAWQGALALGINPGIGPRGTLQVFRPHSSNGNAGHIGINTGPGNMISATSSGVREENYSNNGYWASLNAGWVYAPSSWPGVVGPGVNSDTPGGTPPAPGGPYRMRGNAWFARNSNTTGAADTQWNFAVAGDVPIVSNWDQSDRQTEPAVFRPSNGTWYLRTANTSGGGDASFSFGSAGDWPMLAQVDNDPALEPCVFRPTNAVWFCRYSLTSGGGDFQFQFGLGSDQPMMIDLDADGQAEPVLYRQSNGTWYYRLSNTSGGAERSFAFGSPGDAAAIGQIDNDADPEPCIRRAQRTHCRFSLSSGPGEFWFDFGNAGDWLQFGNVDGDDQAEPVLTR